MLRYLIVKLKKKGHLPFSPFCAIQRWVYIERRSSSLIGSRGLKGREGDTENTLFYNTLRIGKKTKCSSLYLQGRVWISLPFSPWEYKLSRHTWNTTPAFSAITHHYPGWRTVQWVVIGGQLDLSIFLVAYWFLRKTWFLIIFFELTNPYILYTKRKQIFASNFWRLEWVYIYSLFSATYFHTFVTLSVNQDPKGNSDDG